MQEVSARRRPGILGFCGLFFTGGQLCAEISALCDKTYCDGPMEERLHEEQHLDLLTPVKKKKSPNRLSAADKLFSKAVSRVRQQIESFTQLD